MSGRGIDVGACVVGVVGKCVVPTERFCAGVISTTEKQVAV